jgi:hypothetical protein
LDADVYHSIGRINKPLDFQCRNLSADLNLFNIFAIREFLVKKSLLLIEPSISVNNAKECGGALKLRRTQSVRIMLDGLAEIGQRPFLRPFPGDFRRTLALRGPAGNI